MDKITVIEQTTAERMQEIYDLYDNCKPFLNEGLPLRQAVKKVKGTSHTKFASCAWYRDLLNYARDKGYRGQ